MIEFPRPEPGDDPRSGDPGGPVPDGDPDGGPDTSRRAAPAPIPPRTPGMAPEAVRTRRRRLARLGDGIARLSAHITAATARLLAMIRAFDEAEGWHEEGFRSCARWLSWRTGIGPGAAREKVRVARALGELPALSAALAAGELSYSVARAVTRVATPENEAELVGVARHATAAEMERLVGAWRRSQRCAEAALGRERERHAARELWVTPTADGSWRVRGRLDPEVGAVLRKALAAAGEALYRGGAANDDAPAEAKRADALGLVAEAALGQGLGGGRSARGDEAATAADEAGPGVSAETGEANAAGAEDGRPEGSKEAARPGSREPGDEPVTDATGDGEDATTDAPARAAADPAEADATPDPTPAPVVGRAERFQVVVHVSAETLSRGRANGGNGAGAGKGPEAGEEADAAPGEPPRIDGGPALPAETVRRLACDTGLVVMAHDGDGHPLDVGRRTRSVPPALRRALDHRDGGCRFPGCGSRYCDAHHIVPWAEGGETSLENLVLLCRHHHRRVHEDGWTVEVGETGPGGELRVRRPDGWRMRRVPGRPAPPPEPVAALEREQAGAGIDEWTPTTSWDGVAMDVDWTLYTLQEPLPPGTPWEPGDAREPEEAPEPEQPETPEMDGRRGSPESGDPGEPRPPGPVDFPKR